MKKISVLSAVMLATILFVSPRVQALNAKLAEKNVKAGSPVTI